MRVQKVIVSLSKCLQGAGGHEKKFTGCCFHHHHPVIAPSPESQGEGVKVQSCAHGFRAAQNNLPASSSCVGRPPPAEVGAHFANCL